MVEVIGDFVIKLVVALILDLILSYPIMLLWNGCLVPAISGVNQIGWMQALGLGVLVALMVPRGMKKKEVE